MADAAKALADWAAVHGPGLQLPSPQLLANLRRSEALRLTAYQDTKGIWTIGYGHTGPEVVKGLVWTIAQAEAQLLADVARAMRLLDANLPWWRQQILPRRDALAELTFNMGIGNAQHGLLSFAHTLAAWKAGDFAGAAAGLLKSAWANDVKATRAGRIATQVRDGLYA